MKNIPTIAIVRLLFLASIITSCGVYKPMELSSIKPGNIISVSMKGGEKITNLKITAVDSIRIAGQYSVNGSPHQNRILNLNDIQSAQKQDSRARNTTALASLMVVSGLIATLLLLASGQY